MAATTIDLEAQSRTFYVLGKDAMVSIARTSIFLSGLSGLGIEIAKNVLLTGVRAMTVNDTEVTTAYDLGTQFYLDESCLGRNRAEAAAARLADLNPAVSLTVSALDLETADLSMLLGFQCVVLVDASRKALLRVNDFCHANSVPFVAGDVRGLLTWAFVDVGPAYTVADATGEPPIAADIVAISAASPGLVTTGEGHGLQDGDQVTFAEVEGMSALNGTTHTVSVVSFKTFTIGDTSALPPYSHNGQARQIKSPVTFVGATLREQLLGSGPLAAIPGDLGKFDAMETQGALVRALLAFRDEHGRWPAAWHAEDSAAVAALAEATPHGSPLSAKLVAAVVGSAPGALQPLAAFMGGFLGQEVLKLVGRRFSPLGQWLIVDALEAVPAGADPASFAPRGDRYDSTRVCVGQSSLDALAAANVFMVGAGAIGCELLKNFALLGVSTGEGGRYSVTDNDNIEISNLSRQFLFRRADLLKPKAERAVAAAEAMNPALRGHAFSFLERVGQASEALFTDAFFEAQTVVVNALDNVEARLYVDARCVRAQRPLLESGTLGAKGHVQTIIPRLTETYGSQRDPPEKDVPFCTLKSFPFKIEHTIQFARDRFEESFVNTAAELNKFMDTYPSGAERAARLTAAPSECRVVIKALLARPTCWADALVYARTLFQRAFADAVAQLLHSFPPGLLMKDGTPFWASPKRRPTPLVFSAADPLHLAFIAHTARLWAQTWGVAVAAADYTDLAALAAAVSTIEVAARAPKDSAVIETDEKAEKPKDEDEDDLSPAALAAAAATLAARFADGLTLSMSPQSFEKDDYSNSHVDCVAAYANLRARVYAIDEVDLAEVRRIAGKIIPAISTTTAAVSGLVALELIKTLNRAPADCYRNAFLNLSLPQLTLAEPGPPARTPFPGTDGFSVWDRMEVRASDAPTLQAFIDGFAARNGLTVTGVFNGAAAVYMGAMPMHAARKKKRMAELIKTTAAVVDLTVAFAAVDGTAVEGPIVRFHLNQ